MAITNLIVEMTGDEGVTRLELPIALPKRDPVALILEGYGTRKIPVIKVVREYTGLCLRDAKELVEDTGRAPKVFTQADIYASSNLRALECALLEADAAFTVRYNTGNFTRGDVLRKILELAEALAAS